MNASRTVDNNLSRQLYFIASGRSLNHISFTLSNPGSANNLTDFKGNFSFELSKFEINEVYIELSDGTIEFFCIFMNL